ncbi:16S rRNA (cytosine(1402)-N(4))-methyltransferase RsmH [Egibacter rhizosphaerae]|uniref:Ribosomal RNA small subunit methyltransferase H n=1 Tax=Egibacter rhizosphaerae TaxID=1670831 RepID=A0A411YAD3_9ACTN|nr:16S rRNA (cytosine(1402)-N(4))-methyltransferase RsmH [Egibacter rhizosphaerae]QBI18139.1 16S rRNA (cytosine(1402)-N(4))-methyltransferase RsmH [Egibacter rhizosphaerae]
MVPALAIDGGPGEGREDAVPAEARPGGDSGLPGHRPVLLERVVDALAHPGPGLVIDATLGAGGHAAALLERCGSLRLLGLDRDADALALARERLAPYRDRVVLRRAQFDRLGELAADARGPDEAVVGVLLDLGVSSMQLDRADRGFSLRRDGPLDMRMGSGEGTTAADLLDRIDVADLVRLLREGGEDRHARRIADAIVRARPLATTRQLAEVVAAAVPARARGGATHPATRTFQALRIAVNDELGQLRRALPQALSLLARPSDDPAGRGGRLVVLTYHSLEDRPVKRLLADAARGCICPPDLPVCGCGREPALVREPAGGRTPTEDEVGTNPRARSARLRVGHRTDAALPPEVVPPLDQRPSRGSEDPTDPTNPVDPDDPVDPGDPDDEVP